MKRCSMCLAVSGARPRISLGILSGPGVLFLDRVERRVWKVVVSLMVLNMSMGVSGVAICMPCCSLSSPSVQGGGVSMRGGGGAARRVEKKVWMASCMPAGSDTVWEVVGWITASRGSGASGLLKICL